MRVLTKQTTSICNAMDLDAAAGLFYFIVIALVVQFDLVSFQT